MRKPTKTPEQQKRLQAKRTARTVRSREKAATYAKRRQDFLVPALKRKKIQEAKERAEAAAKALPNDPE